MDIKFVKDRTNSNANSTKLPIVALLPPAAKRAAAPESDDLSKVGWLFLCILSVEMFLNFDSVSVSPEAAPRGR